MRGRKRREWQRLRKKALREGRTIVFADESGLSERPHRVRTWAPVGQTPVLEFNFNWQNATTDMREPTATKSDGAVVKSRSVSREHYRDTLMFAVIDGRPVDPGFGALQLGWKSLLSWVRMRAPLISSAIQVFSAA